MAKAIRARGAHGRATPPRNPKKPMATKATQQPAKPPADKPRAKCQPRAPKDTAETSQPKPQGTQGEARTSIPKTSAVESTNKSQTYIEKWFERKKRLDLQRHGATLA